MTQVQIHSWRNRFTRVRKVYPIVFFMLANNDAKWPVYICECTTARFRCITE